MGIREGNSGRGVTRRQSDLDHHLILMMVLIKRWETRDEHRRCRKDVNAIKRWETGKGNQEAGET